MSFNRCENPAKRVKIVYEPVNQIDKRRLEDLEKMANAACKPGQIIDRFKIERTLGEGAFGKVLVGRDVQSGKSAALKLIRKVESKKRVLRMELLALTLIELHDPKDESFCLKMLDCFVTDLHLGIVFPVLGLSVYEFLRQNNFEPFPIDQVRHISQQLCTAVAFLHQNAMTHTDIKPHNILFVNSDYSMVSHPEKNYNVKRVNRADIRLIDFGLLTRDNDQHRVIVSTRYYRAPEVILELGWSNPCDIWSVGCTLVEIYFGSPLFDTNEDCEHLAMMEKTLGAIPSSIAQATKTNCIKDGAVNYVWEGMEEKLSEFFMPLIGYKTGETDGDDNFFNLIAKMLEYEPSKRIKMSEALEHSFFDDTFSVLNCK